MENDFLPVWILHGSGLGAPMVSEPEEGSLAADRAAGAGPGTPHLHPPPVPQGPQQPRLPRQAAAPDIKEDRPLAVPRCLQHGSSGIMLPLAVRASLAFAL